MNMLPLLFYTGLLLQTRVNDPVLDLQQWCSEKLWGTVNQPTFGDGESRRPLWSQNVKTNAAVAVDIWVVDSCGKCNLKADGGERNVRWGWREKKSRGEKQQETRWSTVRHFGLLYYFVEVVYSSTLQKNYFRRHKGQGWPRRHQYISNHV